MDVIDRLNRAMNQLKKLGVDIRMEDLKGVPSGLCIVNNRQVLLVEVSLRSVEQLAIFEQTISGFKSTNKAVA